MKHILATIFTLTYIAAQAQCVGEPNKVTWQQWSNVQDRTITELQAHPDYPLNPDKTIKLYRSKSPVNFDNFMGGRILGYITVPTTTTVTFNVSGNEVVDFYLSSTTSQNDTSRKAYTPAFTELEEHDKYPSQTSNPITLEGGQHYYFELLYAERHGWDHATLYWKNPNIDANNWAVITEEYLYDVDCLDTCPPTGTPCNDGDSNTSNDQHDGYCNCIGTAARPNNCIGNKGHVKAYVYEEINGGNLNDLFNDPDYPAIPHTSEVLSMMGKRITNDPDNSGNLVQAYLTVPVSGMYRFAVTGDNQTRLYISSDDTPENKGNTMIQTLGITNMTEFDKFASQVSSEIYLEKNKYYYIELINKQAAGWYHYRAFWQTPFTADDQWKTIPLTFLYDYNCEVACVPEFTNCNDGNPYTRDDAYDSNCECVGTPCESPNCDSPIGNYVPYDKCGLTSELNNKEENNWLSCTSSASPVSLYNNHKWIQYDLGERYKVFDSHIWNYNVPGMTDKGFQNVSVLYSEDGINYNELLQDNWPLATGNSDYTGFTGPDFMGVYARYILFVSINSAGCRGLGKATFRILKCPLEGTTCDDEDHMTVDDKYDNDCNCIGKSIEENDCDQDYLVLGDSILQSDLYSARIELTSISQIGHRNVVGLVAGSSVELQPGFDSGDSIVLVVNIDPCNGQRPDTLAIPKSEIEHYQEKLAEAQLDKLQIEKHEDSDLVSIQYYASEIGDGLLQLRKNEKTIATLAHREHRKKGIYSKRFRTKKLQPGVYTISWQSKGDSEIRRLIVE